MISEEIKSLKLSWEGVAPLKADRIYIAGPMRGFQNFNFAAFDQAAVDLESRGYIPVNPAQMDREAGFDPLTSQLDTDTLQQIRKRDIDAIENCDGLCLLPGWEKSIGSAAEKAYAEWKGIPVYSYPSMAPIDEVPELEDISVSALRKTRPMFSGLLAYFPDALLAVSNCSYRGNEQHNPGEPLHWARTKSADHLDAGTRHLTDYVTYGIDTDEVPHLAKAAWRILAQLQIDIEEGVSS